MMRRSIHAALFCAVSLAVIASMLAPAGASTVMIQNLDGAGEGFNDPTPVAAVPGNPNTTLGAQRLFAFQYAGDIWGAMLDSPVTIVVAAQMNPQFCDATSAVLGSAGTNFVFRDFVGAAMADTWYPDALADAMAGIDLNPGSADIVATFNSNINGNPSCLGGASWYYGTDLSPPAGSIDFITVVTHELGHGLGFQSFQSSAGVWLSDGSGPHPDIYGRNMVQTQPLVLYTDMTNSQRAAANMGDPTTRWNGASVMANANNILTAGGGGVGRVQLHCPNPFQSGSSISHWSSALSPDQIMEPFYVAPNHDIILEAILFKDLGWTLLQQVATAITAFDARARMFAVDITAAFQSDAPQFTVNVFRGEGSERPTVLIHGVDLRSGDDFSYTDVDVAPGRAYTYQISVRDSDGEFLSSTQTVTVPGVRTSLAQNVPNPFNPTTKISYTLPAEESVTLAIYDTQGRLVRTLVNGVRGPGLYEVTWDGTDAAGTKLGTGVYFCRLVSGTYAESRKMVLLK